MINNHDPAAVLLAEMDAFTERTGAGLRRARELLEAGQFRGARQAFQAAVDVHERMGGEPSDDELAGYVQPAGVAARGAVQRAVAALDAAGCPRTLTIAQTRAQVLELGHVCGTTTAQRVAAARRPPKGSS